MHILGILYIVVMLGALASVGDVVGAWLFDRRAR
jgi:hypothetical protein